MQAPTATRRALLGASAGLVAASGVCWTGAVFGHDIPSQRTSTYPHLPLAKQFVSVGALDQVRTADELALLLDQSASRAATMDILFCPNLEAAPGHAEVGRLGAMAKKHGVLFALYSGTERVPLILTGSDITASGSGVLPTAFGNFTFAGNGDQPDAEIVLGSTASSSGAYTVTGAAIYSPQGDVLATSGRQPEGLVSARIPIAAFRKMRSA